ncbi:TPA: TIGR01440 family protein, partial [Streptococcus pneumoniae]
MNETQIQRETRQVVEDVLEKTNLKQGALFVLGLSSSEVLGGQIGKESSQEIGELIVETILGILGSRGIHLAVQGCEHVNRALVVERQVAEQFGLEIVSVHPTLHAGGSGQLAA